LPGAARSALDPHRERQPTHLHTQLSTLPWRAVPDADRSSDRGRRGRVALSQVAEPPVSQDVLLTIQLLPERVCLAARDPGQVLEFLYSDRPLLRELDDAVNRVKCGRRGVVGAVNSRFKIRKLHHFPTFAQVSFPI